MKARNDSVEEVEKRIGRFVRDRRKAAGLSQEGLADRCGIVRRTLFSLEDGQGGNLRILLAVLAELGELEETMAVFRADSAPDERIRRAGEGGPGKRRATAGSSENPWVMDQHAIL